jgi:hypothetical protein
MLLSDIEGTDMDDNLIGNFYTITANEYHADLIPIIACRDRLDQIVPADLVNTGDAVELIRYNGNWAVFRAKGYEFFLNNGVELEETNRKIKLSKIWRS